MTNQLEDSVRNLVYEKKVIAQPDYNSVLDAGNNATSHRANVLHDYISKRVLIKNFKPDKRDKVLDFGSGVGRLSSFLSPFVKSIVGIDASKTMIDVAEKNRKEQNIEYIHVDTTVIPKVDNSFDKAFAYWVFASISDKMLEENISEIFRVLKPNGRLFFFEQVKKESAYDSNVHKKRTITEYKELLEQHNFVFIHTKEIQRNPSYAMHIWKKYRFLPSFILPLMYHLEQLTLYRKPEFADYYTNVFVFEKRI